MISIAVAKALEWPFEIRLQLAVNPDLPEKTQKVPRRFQNLNRTLTEGCRRSARNSFLEHLHRAGSAAFGDPDQRSLVGIDNDVVRDVRLVVAGGIERPGRTALAAPRLRFVQMP